MERIKPYFPNEVRLSVASAWPNFIKKGYHSSLKLKIDLEKILGKSKDEVLKKRAMLRKTFKRTKFIKNFDFGQVPKSNSLSTFTQIAKKMSKVSTLSVRDDVYRKNGLVTLWPKYMKNLQSLTYDPGMAKDLFAKRSKSLMTDNLRGYLPRLEEIKITSDSYIPYGVFDDIWRDLWRFEKYPSSVKKLSLHLPDFGYEIPETSLAHLKKLKDLEINFVLNKSEEFQNFMIRMISQITQLEALNLTFRKDSEVDDSFCETLKSLTELKKVKLQLPSKNPKKNLEVLKSLQGCPLKSLNLKISLKTSDDILLISDLFEMKEKDLRTLKLCLSIPETAKNSTQMGNLVKAIDSLDVLTSLSFSLDFVLDFMARLKSSQIGTNMNSEGDDIFFQFPHLFSKQVLLRKFRISYNRLSLSKERFFALLEYLKKTSHNLEKLEINIAGYKPQDRSEADTIVEFIRSLKNIRSLKLPTLPIPFASLFSNFIEATKTLRLLKTLNIGEVSSDEVTKKIYLNGVRQILSKNGIQKFHSTLSSEKPSENSGDRQPIKAEEMMKKNPYLIEFKCI